MSDTVIKIENVSKQYRLGIVNHGMLYRDLQGWWARMRGREDPNTMIGTEYPQHVEVGDRFWALKDIDLEVKQGDTLGIIGRNGAGKSTLLQVLSRVTEPTLGQINVKGRIASLLEVGTGFHP
ncbi:MAG: ATP-binding cassette domain-containing protein, partial [Syntrophaceae bacterium]